MKNHTESPDKGQQITPILLAKHLFYTQLRASDMQSQRLTIFGVVCKCPHKTDNSCKNETLNELRGVTKEKLWDRVKALSEDVVRKAHYEHMDCSLEREMDNQ